jgi:hypothetical protein
MNASASTPTRPQSHDVAPIDFEPSVVQLVSAYEHEEVFP